VYRWTKSGSDHQKYMKLQFLMLRHCDAFVGQQKELLACVVQGVAVVLTGYGP
jgi:hypothetical protein